MSFEKQEFQMDERVGVIPTGELAVIDGISRDDSGSLIYHVICDDDSKQWYVCRQFVLKKVVA